jgi:hypothetical protein
MQISDPLLRRPQGASDFFVYGPSRLGITLGECNNILLLFSDDFGTVSPETSHFIDVDFLQTIGLKPDSRALAPTKINRVIGQSMYEQEVLGILKTPLSLTIFRNKKDSQSRRAVVLKSVVVVRNLPVQMHVSWKRLVAEARPDDDWVRKWYTVNVERQFEVESVPLSYHDHPFWKNDGKEAFLPLHIKRFAEAGALRNAAQDDYVSELTVFDSFTPLSESGKEESLRTATTASTSLNAPELDRWASAEGWSRTNGDIGTHMIAFIRNDERLNFWLTTGTVGSYLWHPRQPEKRRTQLFRKAISAQEAREIFKNPRVHTGKGYSTSAVSPTSAYKRGKRNIDYDE